MNARRLLAGGAGSGLLAVAIALSGCSDAAPPPPVSAPTSPRAALVLEPPRIGVGQVAELELAIVTPPGHTPRPWSPPQDVPGLWILASETPEVQKEPSRWVHRTRVRVRAHAVGGSLWPGGTAEVETPEGTTLTVAWEELPIEVVSLIPELAGRTTPFGVRGAPTRSAPGASVWGPAVGGSLFTLACLGLLALARRRRRAAAGQRVAGPPRPRPEPPWQRARRDLDAARALAPERPFDAAHACALALRRYVERRFGAAAAGRTTEELAGSAAPFAATSRWPVFVEILEGLDALRFRAESDRAARDALVARLEGLLDEAAGFVEDSVPPEART